MIFAYLILLLLIIFDGRIYFSKKNFNHSYTTPVETTPIKGIFVILVFFRHFTQYANLNNNTLDHYFFIIDKNSMQLIVTLFLFYSGYGLYTQLQKKGKNYIKSFLKNRFLVTWINFAICIVIYILFNFLISKTYPLKQTLLAFTGWTSIGNSNWYMFATFVLYIFFYLVFIVFSEKYITSYVPILIYTIFTVCLLLILRHFKEYWWWDTILCLPLGMWYKFFQPKIDSTLFSQNKNWCIAFFTTFILFVLSFLYFYKTRTRLFVYLFMNISFCITIILFQMKFSIKRSKILAFYGKHIFSIYIYQRLFFMLFKKIGISNTYLLFILPLLSVTLFSFGYDFLFTKTIQKLFNKTK